MRTKFPKRMLQEVVEETSREDTDMVVMAALFRTGLKRSPHFWEGVSAKDSGEALRGIRRLQGQELITTKEEQAA